MFNRVFSIAVVFVCAVGTLAAQDNFEFEYQEREYKEVQNPNLIKKHGLGDEIARKLVLLREAYTYQELDQITKAETTITEKGAIYNTTKKVIKYLAKNAKKGNIDGDIASLKAETVIDVALNIRYQETETFEALLWKTKDAAELFSVYADKVNMIGYESKLDQDHSSGLSSND